MFSCYRFSLLSREIFNPDLGMFEYSNENDYTLRINSNSVMEPACLCVLSSAQCVALEKVGAKRTPSAHHLEGLAYGRSNISPPSAVRLPYVRLPYTSHRC